MGVNIDFNGNAQTLVYTVSEISAPERIVLKAQGDVINAIDTMNFSEIRGEGGQVQTKVDYTADISLRGWKKPFIVFLKDTFTELGEKAMAGMQATLNQPGRFD